MRDKRVYIAAPYTKPDPAINTRNAIAAGERVLQETTDWLPFVPHLFHLWHLIHPHPYNFWMDMDHNWLKACHAIVMVGDMSEGVKEDLNKASDMALPVFLTLDEFIEWTKEEA